LTPVSLRIEPGEFVTLLGPSGCGKSTLLKMVAGLLSPTGGRVQTHTTTPVSFVFQEATLMPWATVESNVRLPLDLAGVPRAEAAPRVAQALQRVGLGGFSQQRPHELSGGMQMRVSIARALVTQPQVLLMDEPFGALDDITRHKLDADLLTLWRDQGLTVLFVTHSISEAVYLSSRVVVMAARPGRVLEDLRIEAPHPRTEDFRTSVGFNTLVRHLHGQLSAASQDPQERLA